MDAKQPKADNQRRGKSSQRLDATSPALSKKLHAVRNCISYYFFILLPWYCSLSTAVVSCQTGELLRQSRVSGTIFAPHSNIQKFEPPKIRGGKLPWLFKLEPHQKPPPNQSNVNPSRRQPPTAISVIHRIHPQTSRTSGIKSVTYLQDGCPPTEVSSPPFATTAIARRPHPRPRFPDRHFAGVASQPNTCAFGFSGEQEFNMMFHDHTGTTGPTMTSSRRPPPNSRPPRRSPTRMAARPSSSTA